MTHMRRLKHKINLATKQLRHTVKKSRYPASYIHTDVPYFSQWESRELVEPIINGQMSSTDDRNWQNSGASTPEEYAEWSWNGCGMACLKMVIAATRREEIPLVELGKRAADYGVYTMPLDDSPGMFYKPFVKFICAEFGLRGKAESALTIPEIKQALGDSGYVIASVSHEIRFPDQVPTQRGGHLVLVYGYDDNEKVMYLHNPSGFIDTQENVAITEAAFAQFFDHKGIIVCG